MGISTDIFPFRIDQTLLEKKKLKEDELEDFEKSESSKVSRT